MTLRKTQLLLSLFLVIGTINAQNISINEDGTTADASALLDLKSSNKGFLAPRMTTSQRNAVSNPANGLLVYDTDTDSFWFYDSSNWTELNSGIPATIADDDGNTMVQVEESSNDNNIRFDVDGSEAMILTDEGKLGLGTNPTGFLHVKTDPVPSQEVTTASVTNSNTGLYGTSTVSQSFTTSDAGTMSSVAIHTNGSVSVSGTLNIYLGADGSKSLIGSKAFSFSATNNWATVSVSDLNLSLDAFVQYTFEFASLSGRLGHIANSNNPHSGGNYYSNVYGNLTGYDMLFEVKVGAPAYPAYDFLVDDIGKVGIRTTNPEYTLHVNGSVAGTSAYNNVSDRRYKKEIQPLDGAINKLRQIRGVSFDWRQSEFPRMNFSPGREIGFIAQELAPVFPEIVNRDSKGFYTVEYANLVPVLVEAVKELSDQLEVAQQQITEQAAHLATNEKALQALLPKHSNSEAADDIQFNQTENQTHE